MSLKSGIKRQNVKEIDKIKRTKMPFKIWAGNSWIAMKKEKERPLTQLRHSFYNNQLFLSPAFMSPTDWKT